MRHTSDFLVIGSGIAGLSFALKASTLGSVTVITKRAIDECNTRYAQGGIAAVVGPDDSFEDHVRDTEIAGAGLCDRDVVQMCVEDGPKRVAELIEWGVNFTRKTGEGGQPGPFSLGREGGHLKRRVLHAGDITGGEIERALVAAIQANPKIVVREHHVAVNLITSTQLRTGRIDTHKQGRIVGAYVHNKLAERLDVYASKVTVLATGGFGKVYLYTSNPDVATGDGIAMAYRVGAAVGNMEFVQFHPTCLYHPKAKNFLISEALRGEGGELIAADGEKFMRQYHELGSLAPRDIVARAIDAELKRRGDDSVFLDMTHLDRAFIEERFPNIDAACRSFGVDMAKDPIPVVPACHYACGGILVDRAGQSSLPGLMAIGEATCTGLHGANRLASNSLLEGIVYAHRAVERLQEQFSELPTPPTDIPEWDPGLARPSEEAVIVSQAWDELRRLMWNYVGIVRTNKRLFRAKRRIDIIESEVREYYWEYTITSDLVELRNLVTIAKLIVESALRRRESRGLHYNLDYSSRDDDNWQSNTIVDRLMLEGV